MKKIIRKTGKIIGIFLAGFLGFVILYWGAVCFLSRITVNKDAEPGDYTTVYIKTNGAHTDIVVPIQTDVIDWRTLVDIDQTKGRDHAVEYAAFGWGDKGFFLDIETWDELTFPIAFKAVFWLGTTAMHVTFYKAIQENDQCKSIAISREQYEALVRYIYREVPKRRTREFYSSSKPTPITERTISFMKRAGDITFSLPATPGSMAR